MHCKIQIRTKPRPRLKERPSPRMKLFILMNLNCKHFEFIATFTAVNNQVMTLLFSTIQSQICGGHERTLHKLLLTYHFTVLEVDYLALFGKFLLAISSHFNRNSHDCECCVRVEDFPTHIWHRVHVGHANLTKEKKNCPQNECNHT